MQSSIYAEDKKLLLKSVQNSNHQKLVYYVKDNGAGFNMENDDKLFAVFQRLYTTKEFERTCVGLVSVQRSIIIKHGGNVWAEGKINEALPFIFLSLLFN